MKFKRQSSPEVAVNLTPLIDVVFLLLIFFMVSTTFTKESHLTLTLPEASGQPAQQPPQMIEIVVNASGEYVVNGKKLINQELLTLKAAISKLAEGESDVPVVITADGAASHQSVVRVMDACGQLGLHQLSITTVNPPNPS